jgi:hypothetical protein
MATRTVELRDLNGNIFDKSAEVPIKGIAGKPPSLVMMGDKSFEWDAKAGFYRQAQAYVIPLPYFRSLSGW